MRGQRLGTQKGIFSYRPQRGTQIADQGANHGEKEGTSKQMFGDRNPCGVTKVRGIEKKVEV